MIDGTIEGYKIYIENCNKTKLILALRMTFGEYLDFYK